MKSRITIIWERSEDGLAFHLDSDMNKTYLAEVLGVLETAKLEMIDKYRAKQKTIIDITKRK